MTTAVPERSHSSAPPTWMVAVLATILLGTLTLASGCKSPKEKATEVFKDGHLACLDADGRFHEVSLFAGGETTEILAETCDEEMGEVEVEKGHSATVEIGPYTWEAGIDDSTGIWVMKGVRWEPLDQALSRLDRRDPGENELKRAADLLGEAQEAYPKSSWIRLKRLETLLRHRELTRSTKSEDGYKLGDAVETHLDETLEWAQSDDNRATEVRARLKIVDYLQDFAKTVDDSVESLGSGDKALEKSIEVAEEKGNDEEADEYRDELEKLQQERPEKRKKYEKLAKDARTEMCAHLSKVKSDGIEDEDLKRRAQSTKDAIDCRRLLKEREDGDGEEGDGE